MPVFAMVHHQLQSSYIFAFVVKMTTRISDNIMTWSIKVKVNLTLNLLQNLIMLKENQLLAVKQNRP